MIVLTRTTSLRKVPATGFTKKWLQLPQHHTLLFLDSSVVLKKKSVILLLINYPKCVTIPLIFSCQIALEIFTKLQNICRILGDNQRSSREGQVEGVSGLRPVSAFGTKHGPDAPPRAEHVERLREAVVVNDSGVHGKEPHQQDDVAASKHHVEHLQAHTHTHTYCMPLYCKV